MTHIFRIFRTHAALLVLVFFIALIYGGAHFVFQKWLADQGLPYYPMLINLDERNYTAAKVNAVFRDGVISGDINLWEHRGAPFMMPPLPHLIMGYLSRALGSLKAGFIAGDIIFPALSFFLLYLLGFELSRKKTFAALFASVVFFATRALLFFPLLTRYYQAYIITAAFRPQGRLYFDRFEDPLLTTPFFFLSLYLLLRTLIRGERWTPMLAGISAGLLFYAYFYYAVYFFVALGAIAVIFLLQKNYAGIKKIIMTGTIGLATSSLYWINFLALTRLPTYADIISRIGPEHGHAPFFYLVPSFAYIQHAVLAVLLYLLLRRESPVRAAYMTALLLPVFVVYNFQIVTGFNPQPDHWIKPRQFILTLSFLYLAFLLLKNHPRLFSIKYILPIALPVVLFLFWKGTATENASVQMASWGIAVGIIGIGGAYAILKRRLSLTPFRYAGALSLIAIAALCAKGFFTARAFTDNKENLSAATISSSEAASYRWLNTHTPPQSVIGSISATTNNHLQIFTANKLFVSGANNTIASNQELLDRFMVMNRLWGVDPDTFGAYFPTDETYPPKDEDHSAVGYLFGDRYRAQSPGSIFTNKGFGAPRLTEDQQQQAIMQYRGILKEKQGSLPYRLNYLYAGPRERALTPDAPALAPFEKIYDQDGIMIYLYK